MANLPKNIVAFTVSWDNIGDVDEVMKVHWDGGFQPFLVGTECFLESATNTSQVPDLQLIGSVRMAAILAGEILPGTAEYNEAMIQDGLLEQAKYFQTIIGDVQLKTCVGVSDTNYGPEGTVFDLTFNKKGSLNNTKTVRADAWSLSQYNDGSNSLGQQVFCVPGALHKELGLKKSQLGAAGSANRLAVEGFVSSKKFWV